MDTGKGRSKKTSLCAFDEPAHWPATFGATASVSLKGRRAGSVQRLIEKNQDPAQEGRPMDSMTQDRLLAERLSMNKFSTLKECHLKLFRTYFRTEWTEDLLMSIFFETIPVLHRPDEPADVTERHMNKAPFGVIADNVEHDFMNTARQRAFYMQEARRAKHVLNSPGEPFDEVRGSGPQFFKDANTLYQAAQAELHKARDAPWWELRPERCGQLRTSGLRKLVHLHLSTLRELSGRTEGDDAFVQVATAADEPEIALQVAYMLEYRAQARAAKLQSHRKRITASLHALARKMRAEEDACQKTWKGMFDAMRGTMLPQMMRDTEEMLKITSISETHRERLNGKLRILNGSDPDAIDKIVQGEIENEMKATIRAFKSLAADGTAGAAAAVVKIPNDVLDHCQMHVKHSESFEKTYTAYKNMLQLGASIDDALAIPHLSLLGTQVKLYPMGAEPGSYADEMPETLSEAMIRQRDMSNKCLFARTNKSATAGSMTTLVQGLAALRASEKDSAAVRRQDRLEGLKHMYEQRFLSRVHLQSNEVLFGTTHKVTNVDLKRCKIKEDEPTANWYSEFCRSVPHAPGHCAMSSRAIKCYGSHFGREGASPAPAPAKSTHERPDEYIGSRTTPKVSVPTFMDPPMLPMRVSAPPREGKTALSLLLASFAVKLGFTVLLGVAPNKKIPVSEMFEKLNKLHWDEPVDVLSDEHDDDQMTPTFGSDYKAAEARSAGLVTAFIQGTPENPVLCVRRADAEPRRIPLSRDNHVEMAKALHSGNRANRVRLIVFSTMELADIEGVARILRFIEEEDVAGLAFKMYDEAQFLCKDEPVVPLRKYKKVDDFKFDDGAWNSKVDVKQELDAVRATYPLIYGLNCCITATHLATFFERPLYGSLQAESSPPIVLTASRDPKLTESERHNIEQKLLHRQAPLVLDARRRNRTYYPVLPPALQPRKIQVFDPLFEYSDSGEYSGKLENVTYVGSSAIIGPIWSCVEYFDRLECSPTLRLDEGLIGRAVAPASRKRKTATLDDSDDDSDDSDDDATVGEEETDGLETILEFLDVKDPSWNLRLATVQFVDFLIGRLHRTEAVPPAETEVHLADRYGNWFDEVHANDSNTGVHATVVIPTHVMAVSKNVQADMGMLHQIRWLQIHGLFANFCRSGRLLLQPKLYKGGVVSAPKRGVLFWRNVRPPTDELFHLHHTEIRSPLVDDTPTWAMRAARRMLEPSLGLDNFVAENGFGFVVFASNAAVDATKIKKAGAHGGFVELNETLVSQVSSNLASLCRFEAPSSLEGVNLQLEASFKAVRATLTGSRTTWPSDATRDFALSLGIDYAQQSVLAENDASRAFGMMGPYTLFRRLGLLWWKERWQKISKVIMDHTVKDADTKCVLFLSDPLLDANNVHDPYHHWHTDNDFNHGTRPRHQSRNPGDGLKNGPVAGRNYLRDASNKLVDKGKEIMNSILSLEAKARELITKYKPTASANHGPDHFCANFPPEERNSEFFDHLMNSMIKQGRGADGQVAPLKLGQVPDANDSAVVFLLELKHSEKSVFDAISADLENDKSDAASRLSKTLQDDYRFSKKHFGAPLKKAVEYSELLYMVREELESPYYQNMDETSSHDAVEPGPSASATKLEAESRFKSDFLSARSHEAGATEWYSDISTAFPDLRELIGKVKTDADDDDDYRSASGPTKSYARGRTWAFRCASADDALAIARAMGIFKMTMVGYDAMSAGLTIQSQVRSDNGDFYQFVASKGAQNEFLRANSDPVLAETPIDAVALLELARSNQPSSALLANKSVLTQCVKSCIDLVTASTPFMDVVDEYKAFSPTGRTPYMNFDWGEIVKALEKMAENYAEGEEQMSMKTYLDLGLHHVRDKTRICYVPGSIALASSKNVALDDAYQMLGRTFVDMKTIPLPRGWEVSMLGAMCRPAIGKKPAKMWTESSFDLFTKAAAAYEDPSSKFGRIKEYADRYKAQIAFLEVLRQLASVEHALADEPSPTGQALKSLTGLRKFPNHLASSLPGTESVLVPQGVKVVNDDQHALESSHMSTLLRMQSRGLYTGLAAAMLGNSREPRPGAEEVSVSVASNRAAQPMADALRAAFVHATSLHSGDFEPANFETLSAECKTMLTRRVGHRDHGTGASAVTASWRVFYQNLK